MNADTIINNTLLEIDSFNGSDDEYITLIKELIGELEIRLEGKEMEMGCE